MFIIPYFFVGWCGVVSLLFLVMCFLLWCLLYGRGEISIMSCFWEIVSRRLVESFGLSPKKPLSAFYAPIVFITIFSLLVTGLFAYGTAYLHSLANVLTLSYTFWFSTFLCVLSGRRFSSIVFHRQYGLFMACFLLPIEIIGIVMRPISLAVRLFANVIFGHYVLHYTFALVSSPVLAPVAVMLMGPFVCFELAVYLVQSYIFTFLVIIYLEE